MTLTTKRQLTLPLISISHTPDITFVACGEIQETTMPDPGGTESGRAFVIEGRFHGAMDHVLLCLNTVMRTALERAGAPLAGRIFHFKFVGKRPGKRYADVQVVELEETE